MERKKKEKIKKRTKRRRKIPGQGSKRSKKGKKQFSIKERKRTEILRSQIATPNHS